MISTVHTVACLIYGVRSTYHYLLVSDGVAILVGPVPCLFLLLAWAQRTAGPLQDGDASTIISHPIALKTRAPVASCATAAALEAQLERCGCGAGSVFPQTAPAPVPAGAAGSTGTPSFPVTLSSRLFITDDLRLRPRAGLSFSLSSPKAVNKNQI